MKHQNRNHIWVPEAMRPYVYGLYGAIVNRPHGVVDSPIVESIADKWIERYCAPVVATSRRCDHRRKRACPLPMRSRRYCFYAVGPAAWAQHGLPVSGEDLNFVGLRRDYLSPSLRAKLALAHEMAHEGHIFCEGLSQGNMPFKTIIRCEMEAEWQRLHELRRLAPRKRILFTWISVSRFPRALFAALRARLGLSVSLVMIMALIAILVKGSDAIPQHIILSAPVFWICTTSAAAGASILTYKIIAVLIAIRRLTRDNRMGK